MYKLNYLPILRKRVYKTPNCYHIIRYKLKSFREILIALRAVNGLFEPQLPTIFSGVYSQRTISICLSVSNFNSLSGD